MAGMLPGVEAARRRRVHQTCTPAVGVVNNCSSPSSRRSSFSLYAVNYSYDSSLIQERSNRGDHQEVDEHHGQLVREAKKRLDMRLGAQSKSPIFRKEEGEVYGSKKKGGEKKSKGWANKLGWKEEEKGKCGVCLDVLMESDNLEDLSCNHRFHSMCL